MSFYDEMTTEEERLNYSLMLEMIGSLSNLFSESPSPYLASRISENLFCRCFFADNLSRNDVTADAKRGKTGIGIKTWTGSQSQKIAEFDALRNTYINDEPEILISKVAGYRNDRIQKTLDTYSIDTMVYHCLLRTEGLISVYECPLVKIDVGNITKIKKTGASIYFEDGINAYSFNLSKSTLFKRFDDLELMNEIPVTIIEDPYEYLAEKMGLLDKIKRLQIRTEPGVSHIETAYLPLYSFNNKAGFFVPPKECLNIRFAGGRRRDPYEVGIRIPKPFRDAKPDFFPGRSISFRLILPDGTELSAKQCQDGGKSLMSNPNSALGHWLIDRVLRIDPSETITYEMLARLGIDSVQVRKMRKDADGEVFYKIDFAGTGSYEQYKEKWIDVDIDE